MLRRVVWLFAFGIGCSALVGPAAAAPAAGWHQTLEEGLAAAAKSGKPVLAVTLWKRGT